MGLDKNQEIATLALIIEVAEEVAQTGNLSEVRDGLTGLRAL